MKKIIVLIMFMLPMTAFAEGIPANMPINQSIFQPETTRPLYNIERNSYTNSAIQQLTVPKEEPVAEQTQKQKSEESQGKGLKGLFEGFTVEW